MASGREQSEPAQLLGQRVVLDGLSARPELNGRLAAAESFEGGRYVVALEGSGDRVRVRPENVSPVAVVERSSGGRASTAEVLAAARRGDEPAILAWLEGGGRVNASGQLGGQSGATVLIHAAYGGHERVVDLLLRHGAEIDLPDSKGGTALMWATCVGHERVVELLIRRGAQANVQSSDGDSALMYAAIQGHERVVELLLRYGAEIKLQNNKGGTALMYDRPRRRRLAQRVR